MALIKEPWPLTAARYTKDFMRDKSGLFPRMKHERILMRRKCAQIENKQIFGQD